jgi:hypothetical protein
MTYLSKHKKSKHKKSKHKKTKRKHNRRYLKGGSLGTLDDIYPPNEGRTAIWRAGTTPWTTLVKTRGLNLYGTSLPLWDRFSMENIFRFYLFRKGIKRVISLQGCGSVDQPPPLNNVEDVCEPDIMLENTVFNDTKGFHPVTLNDPRVEIIYHTIQDMEPGSIIVWVNLTRYYMDSCDEMTLVHCYAGFGRTGSVLLYYLMEKHEDLGEIITDYMGQGSSLGMYNYIWGFLHRNLRIDDNRRENGDEINQRIAAFDPTDLVDEVMLVDELHGANLLISRINLIILMMAHHAPLPHGEMIVLYRTFTPVTWAAGGDLFVPIPVAFIHAQLNQAFLNTVFIV